MLCIGNSHMASVLAAAQQSGVSLDAIVFKESRYFREIEGGVEFVEPTLLADSLAKRDLRLPIYSFIGGTSHLSKVFRLSPRPYDFFLPAAPYLPIERRAELVPLNALRTALVRTLGMHLEALETLIRLSDGPVFHFEPPPPPSVQWWEEAEGQESSDPSFALEGMPYLRYKLWRLNSEIVGELLDRCGGTFVERPAAATDEDGLLLAEYCANSTHANQAYGALVLEQMQALA